VVVVPVVAGFAAVVAGVGGSEAVPVLLGLDGVPVAPVPEPVMAAFWYFSDASCITLAAPALSPDAANSAAFWRAAVISGGSPGRGSMLGVPVATTAVPDPKPRMEAMVVITRPYAACSTSSAPRVRTTYSNHWTTPK